MRLNNLRFGLSIRPEGKSPAPEFNHHDLDDLAIVYGEEGQKFTIEVANYSDEQAFCVISVNGVSIITLQTASRSDNEGLVLKPFEKVKLDRFVFPPQAELEFKYPQTTVLGIVGVAYYVINGGDSTLVDGFVKNGIEWDSEPCYRSFDLAALAVLYYIPPVLSDNLLEHYRSSSLPNPFPADSGKISGR